MLLRSDDPILSQLIARALSDNLDIAQGVARLRQARASLSGARAERLPSITTSGGGGRDFRSNGPDSDSYSGGADASWEANIFGGQAREIEASRADFEAAGYDLHTIRTRSEEHTSELQSLMRTSYAVFCLQKKKQTQTQQTKKKRTQQTQHRQSKNTR